MTSSAGSTSTSSSPAVSATTPPWSAPCPPAAAGSTSAPPALENPEWCERIIAEYGDRVAIGLDTRQIDGEWRLRGRGWVSDGGDLWEVLERLDQQGCSRFVVTDVSRDGMLTGPNIDLLRDVAAATSAPVVASGGISSLDDLRNLAAVVDEGVDSAILGKSLYAGKFTLQDALTVARGEEPTA
jgi:phosphoribosylformimino-5-aminoimidazole carboxamide ribonucleotide (ProFAR) isomerase